MRPQINAEILLKELQDELRKVEVNIMDPLCDPKVKRKITLTIVVDPHGDETAMPIITAHIGHTLAPRDCSAIAAVCQQMSLFDTGDREVPEVLGDA